MKLASDRERLREAIKLLGQASNLVRLCRGIDGRDRRTVLGHIALDRGTLRGMFKAMEQAATDE